MFRNNNDLFLAIYLNRKYLNQIYEERNDENVNIHLLIFREEIFLYLYIYRDIFIFFIFISRS